MGGSFSSRRARWIAAVVAVGLLVGPVTSGADAQVATGTVGGITTPNGGGFPIAPQVCVRAYDTSRQLAGSAMASGASGQYQLTLPAGDYYLFFYPCGSTVSITTRLPELYNNARTWTDAEVVTVTAGGSVARNAGLDTRGRMSGRVIDQFGNPLVCDVVSLAVGSDPIIYDGDRSDVAGGYELKGFVGGNRVAADCGPGFGTHLHPDVVTIGSTGAIVSVADFVVPQEPRSISGTVASDGGTGVYTCVAAVSPSGEFLAMTTTDFSSPAPRRWILTDLPPGPVRLGFIDCASGGIVPEWWEDQADPADATEVTVLADAPVTGIHAEVTSLAQFGVIVKDAAGLAVDGACVWVADPAVTTLVGAAYIGAAGHASMDIPPGDYKVLFTDCGGGWASEWYQDVPDAASATIVTVVEGNQNLNVTLQLA